MRVLATTPAAFLLTLLSMIVGAAHHASAQQLFEEIDSHFVGWPPSGGYFGEAIAFAGDIDGDGVVDLAIGASDDRTSSGRVQLFSGRTGDWIWSAIGEHRGDRLGRAIAGIGDFDGDGIDDLVAGALTFDGPAGVEAGRAYVLSGASGAILASIDGNSSTGWFGRAVAAIGDLDGDGAVDFAVSAWRDHTGSFAGEVYVYSGATAALLFSVAGTQLDQDFGSAIAPAGDVDRDGIPDLIVGSDRFGPADVARGRVDVISGADHSSLLAVVGAPPHSIAFGRTVAGGSDLDGDSVPDFLVGDAEENRNGPSTGSAYVFSGADGSLLFQWRGEKAGDQLGFAVAFAGDVNGDGVDDVLVGKPGFKTIGHALLLSGRTGKLLYDFAAGSGDNEFGRALLGGRDVDGDGLVDVIVGAPKDVKKFKMSGRAFVFSGNDLFLQAQPSDPLAGDTLKLGTRGREPAAPAVLAIVGVNGSPTFTVVDAGLLDERSRRLLVAVVPPGLAGIAVDFQAFALDSRDGVIDSSVATVEFR